MYWVGYISATERNVGLRFRLGNFPWEQLLSGIGSSVSLLGEFSIKIGIFGLFISQRETHWSLGTPLCLWKRNERGHEVGWHLQRDSYGNGDRWLRQLGQRDLQHAHR